MANKDLDMRAHHISADVWWYEVDAGIEVIHHVNDADGNYLRTDHMLIKWASLRAALKRKDK